MRVTEQCSTGTISLPVMTSSEPMQTDISPSLEMVRREILFLKRYKAAGPNGLSSSFFKDGGDFLTLELTKL